MSDITTNFSPRSNVSSGQSLSEYGVSLAKREMSNFQAGPERPVVGRGHASAQISISVLEYAIWAFKRFDAIPSLLKNAEPVLRHTDLHLGNIFVSNEPPCQVTSLIDWQSTSVAPLFLQTRWPEFLNRLRDMSEALCIPRNQTISISLMIRSRE